LEAELRRAQEQVAEAEAQRAEARRDGEQARREVEAVRKDVDVARKEAEAARKATEEVLALLSSLLNISWPPISMSLSVHALVLIFIIVVTNMTHLSILVMLCAPSSLLLSPHLPSSSPQHKGSTRALVERLVRDNARLEGVQRRERLMRDCEAIGRIVTVR
jgi:multidrug efflux pump subunit AcrA (membrane-fusion protein)